MATDISIIIPAKDRLWSLPRAIESCRSRQLEVEIIVIDDASTDGTTEWLATQSDVCVIDGMGWGKPAGVNRAQQMACGKYIRFLDSDDWLNPNANEDQFDAAECEAADVVVSGVDVYDDETFVERSPWIPTDDFIAQQLGETSASHYSSFLFRRAFIQDVPHRTFFPASDFASRDDRCLILEVAMRRPKLAVTATPALCHRTHERARLQRQTGLRSFGTHIQQLYIYRQVLRLLEARGELTVRRRRAATNVLWPLAHWLAYVDLEEASRLVEEIEVLDPAFRVPETGALGSLYRSVGFRNTERILAVRRWIRRTIGLAAISHALKSFRCHRRQSRAGA